VNADYLRVAIERDGAVCVLRVSGELDFLTAGEFAQRARVLADVEPERLVLDLSGLVFADCCGARALAAAIRVVPGGCPVIVRSVRPMVRRLLDLLGLNLERGDEPGADRIHGAAVSSRSQA
jgi:anti-anti-sigma factor